MGAVGLDADLVLDAGQSAQLRLDHHAVIVRILDDLAGDLDVLRERLGGRVDHDGGEAAVNAGLAGLKAVAMIQVQRDRNLRALDDRGLNQLHQVGVVGIRAGALGNLQDDRGLLLAAGLGDGLDDLHVVHVESADSVAAVVSLLEHFGSSNKSHCHSLLQPISARRQTAYRADCHHLVTVYSIAIF